MHQMRFFCQATLLMTAACLLTQYLTLKVSKYLALFYGTVSQHFNITTAR